MTDPFASSGNFEKKPSLSFPVGKEYRMLLTKAPKLVDKKINGKVETWPGSNDPKKTVVTEVEIDGQGFSVWAERGSERFNALQAAQQEASSQMSEGGVLVGGCTGEVKGKGTFMKKVYEFKYTPQNALADSDEKIPF